MDVADIRNMEVDDHGVSHEAMMRDQARNQSRILREIAAQLAELQICIRLLPSRFHDSRDPRGLD